MSETVFIQEMTWREVRGRLTDGVTTAVLPCGSVEQHGPHLPTGTDSYLGTAIAERAARRAGNVLVAPTLSIGISEHHMHFPGSFTAQLQTFVALLSDCCESLTRQGFARILTFSAHGGNVDALRAYAPTIARKIAPQCEFVLYSHRVGERARMVAACAEEGVGASAAGVHAGYLETSMMLAYRPDLVRMEYAEPGRCDDDFYRPENLARSQMESFLHGVGVQSPNGVLGDPTGSNPEIGERLLDIAAESILRDLIDTPVPASR